MKNLSNIQEKNCLILHGINRILQGLFLHPILHEEYLPPSYLTFSGGLVEQKYLVGLMLFFSIIIWGDDVILPVDDIMFLVKNYFLLLFRCSLPFRSIVYVFLFEGYFILQ